MVITYAENVDDFNTQRHYSSSPTFGCGDPLSVENTFRYIVSQVQKGIFVKIYNNVLVNFIVFNVRDFENGWGDRIKVDPRYFSSLVDFIKHVARKTRAPLSLSDIELDTTKWRCNNGLLRFENPPVDNQKNIECIHDMFSELCSSSFVPDVEFFVNKRDFPIRRSGPYEPFHHIWDSKRYPLKSNVYSEYAPILSQCSEQDFADVAIPTYDDWALAREREDGIHFEDSRVGQIFQPITWKEKKNMAVFRGTSTGIGTTSENNARMKLVKMCQKFPTLFDVGFTRINYRPRKQYKNPYIQTVEERFKCVEPLSLQQQTAYKFIINVEGHTCAFRLSSELVSGSCVLIVDSAWKLWFQPSLVPYKHYVPVKNDFSNLITQMRWCLDNDQQCKNIAEESFSLVHSLLSKRGMLHFLKTTLDSFSKSCVYTEKFKFRHDPIATRQSLKNIVVPGVEFDEEDRRAVPTATCAESTLLATLVVWHAHTLYKMTWGHGNVVFKTLPKKRCLSYCLAGNWYQLWTSKSMFWPLIEDTTLCVKDRWYGPLIWKPLSDLDFLPIEKLNLDIDTISLYAERWNIVFKPDCCVSRIENRLFQIPMFCFDNIFFLTYYCVRILSFIPKAAQKSNDPVWKRWQNTFAHVLLFYKNNVEKTRQMPIFFEIYSFPQAASKILCDYTKWNLKIKHVLNHRGPFALCKKDQEYYTKHFEPLFKTPDNYTFLVASHNTVLAYFENTR